MKKIIKYVIIISIFLTMISQFPIKIQANVTIKKNIAVGASIILTDNNWVNATEYFKSWSSSNPSVASVSGNSTTALVTGLSSGTAVITCQTSAYKSTLTHILGADGKWYPQENITNYSSTQQFTIQVLEHHKVTFDANGGSKTTTLSILDGTSFSTLPVPTRSQYIFRGWYSNSTNGTKLTTNTIIHNNETYYALWDKINISKGKTPSLKAGYKKITVSYPKLNGVKGYQIRYSLNSKMKNAKAISTTSTSKVIENLQSNTKYYIQVRGYNIDSCKKKLYGSCSKITSITTPKYILNTVKQTRVKSTSFTLKLLGAGGKESFSSADPSIAKINSKGVVTCLKKGSTRLTAKYKNKKYVCKVIVQEPSLNMKALRVLKNQQQTLKLENTTLKTTFKSDDPSIATIDSKGLITAKKNGRTKVYAIIQNKRYACSIKVETPSFSHSKIVDVVGNSDTLVVSKTTLPCTFTSSDINIVTIDQNGLMQYRSKGSAKVYITINGEKYSVDVSLEDPQPNAIEKTIVKTHGRFQFKLEDTIHHVSYSSDDETIASVNANGVIHGNKVGSTTIRAKVLNTDYCLKVNVVDIHPISDYIEMQISDQVALELNNETNLDHWEIATSGSESFTLDDNKVTANTAGFGTVYAILTDETKIPIKIKAIGKEGTITNPKVLTVDDTGYKTIIFPGKTASIKIGSFTFFHFAQTYLEENRLTINMSVTCHLLNTNSSSPYRMKDLFPAIKGNEPFYDSKGNAYYGKIITETGLENKLIEGKTQAFTVTLEFNKEINENLAMPLYRGNKNVNTTLPVAYITTAINTDQLP